MFRMTLLREFLTNAMLTTNAEEQADGDNNNVSSVPSALGSAKLNMRTQKVTISTCHAAKGLEWPVVFIPGGEFQLSGFTIRVNQTKNVVETDIFPFKRSEDFNEERRLLYVAATRAQGLLYMLHCGQRMVGGDKDARQLSRFIKIPLTDDKRLMSPELPNINVQNLEILAKVIRRPEPDAEECVSRMTELCAVPTRHLQASLADWLNSATSRT
jgi:superfamily I DNA/RNA helicase